MILLSEAHFYVLKLTKWPEIFSGHKILHILYIFHALSFSRNIVCLLYWRMKYVTPIVSVMGSHVGRGSSSLACLHLPNPLRQHGQQWSREFSWHLKTNVQWLFGGLFWPGAITSPRSSAPGHSVVSMELVLWLVVECAEKLAQCSQGFDSFLEFEQKTQILETVVNLQSFCVFSRVLLCQDSSVVVSTESSGYRQEAEGRGVVWAVELESGRAPSAVLALQAVGSC